MQVRSPRNTLLVTGIFLITIAVAGCTEEQGPAEEAGEKIDEAAEDLQEDAGEATEQAGDAIEDATDQ